MGSISQRQVQLQPQRPPSQHEPGQVVLGLFNRGRIVVCLSLVSDLHDAYLGVSRITSRQVSSHTPLRDERFGLRQFGQAGEWGVVREEEEEDVSIPDRLRRWRIFARWARDRQSLGEGVRDR